MKPIPPAKSTHTHSYKSFAQTAIECRVEQFA